MICDTCKRNLPPRELYIQKSGFTYTCIDCINTGWEVHKKNCRNKQVKVDVDLFISVVKQLDAKDERVRKELIVALKKDNLQALIIAIRLE